MRVVSRRSDRAKEWSFPLMDTLPVAQAAADPLGSAPE